MQKRRIAAVSSSSKTADSPPPREPRKRRGWLVVLVVLVVLVAMTPTLIATTASHNRLLAGAVPPEVGTVTAQTSTVGWTGPLGLSGVEFRDPQGGLVATADRVEAPGGWITLLGNAAIDVVVTNPVIYANVSPAGSNLEAIAARLQQERDQETDGAPATDGKAKRLVRVRISGGVARIADAATGERWQASGVEADVTLGAAGQQRVNARGTIAEVDGQTGEFVIEQTSDPVVDGLRPQRLAVNAANVPASLIGIGLRRSDPTARVVGAISGGGQVAWVEPTTLDPAPQAPGSFVASAMKHRVTTAGELRVENAAYRGRLSRGETVRLQGVSAPWDVAATPGGLAINRFAPSLDFVNVNLAGTLFPDGGQQLAGQLTADLARLAAIAPEALAVRDGVRIDSGELVAKFDVQRNGGGSQVRFDARSDGFAGVSTQGPIRWPTPIRMQVQAVGPAAVNTDQPMAGWRVESLTCESRFLTAQAGGDATQVQGTAQLDLAKLATDVGQFLDLGDYRLAGTGEASFTWRRLDAKTNQIESTGMLDRVLIGSSEKPLVQEPQLNYRVDARTTSAGAASLVASCELKSGGDTLTVDIRPAQQGAGVREFRSKLVGSAASWFRRVRLVRSDLPTPEALQLGGAIEANANGRFDAQRGRIETLAAAVKDFVVVTPATDSGEPGLVIREPLVEIEADASWEPGKIRSSRGQLKSSTVALSTRDLEIVPGAADSWRGQVAFRSDLAQLSQWWLAASPTGAVGIEGRLEGKATLRGVPEGTRLEASATGESLRLVRFEQAGPQELWREPRLNLETRAMVRPAPRRDGSSGVGLQIEDLRVASQTVTGSAGGQIEDLQRMAGVKLAGGVDYDLEKLSPVLWPKLADSVRLFGKDTARFQVESTAPNSANTLPAPNTVAGPSNGIATLTGRIEAPWQGADLFGLPVGPGKLGASLAGGVVRIDPLDVQVGDAGRLTSQVAARIAPAPMYAEAAPGPLVSNVAISQAVSERVLKYIAPVLADATRADGRFSISLAEARAPLEQPKLSRVQGQLNVHSVQVLPGPSIAEMVALVRQIRGVVRDGVEGIADSNERPIVRISDRVIDFQMADGRVYHRGLEFFVGDALVISEGSVGVDETLDLLLRVPIQEEWVQQRPVLLGGLRGRSIDIPVRGTFKKPEIDREAFRQISRDLIQSAAAGAIDGLLRGLLAPR